MRLWALFTFFLLQQPTAQNGTIEGTVIQFGTGLPMIDVEILIAGTGRNVGFTTPQAITDAKGHFVIDDVPPGSYAIRAQRLGFANPAPNGVRLQEGGASRTVSVSAGQHVENANLSLVPGGAISGRVLTPAGKPALAVDMFLGSTDGGSARYTSTDDLGRFHVVGIAPGKYVLGATADGGKTTFFPGVTSQTSAAPLDIAEGMILGGLEFAILNESVSVEKTFIVSGRMLSSKDGPFSIFPVVRLLPKFSASSENGIASSIGEGTFSFYNVHPGSYELYLLHNPGNSFILDPKRLGVIGQVDVNVNDRDVKDLTITPGGVSIQGRLVSANSAPPSASVRLVMTDKAIQSRDGKADVLGSFTIPNVVNGTWRVEAIELPANWGLADVRQGDRSIYDSGLAVGDRPPESIQVVLDPAGSIDGTVRDPQTRPLGAARVVLISQSMDPTRSATLYRTTTTDGAGHFTFANTVEGRYSIFAFDSARFPSNAFEDTARVREFLSPYESLGSAVPVRSGVRSDVSILSIREPR